MNVIQQLVAIGEWMGFQAKEGTAYRKRRESRCPMASANRKSWESYLYF